MPGQVTLPYQKESQGAQRTYDLADWEKALPGDGGIPVYDASRHLYVPRALAISDLPAIGISDLSDVTTNTLVDGQHLIALSGNWVNDFPVLDDCSDVSVGSPSAGDMLVWTGSAWVPSKSVVPTGLLAGTCSLTDLTMSSTPANWNPALGRTSITDPGRKVTIIATLTGFVRDFTNAALGQVALHISTDGGSTYTASQTLDWTITGGGSTNNRMTVAVTFGLNGVTPTGSILYRGVCTSNSTTTVFQDGRISVVVIPEA